MADEGNQNNVLMETASVSSVNGVLETSIRLKLSTHQIGDGLSLTTRTLNGTIPGPTLRVKPGDTLIINFHNDLEDQNLPYIHNEHSAPDESNLHFHGLHVSGELPSDDVTFVVQPGQSYRYSTTLPTDHMPGTHWLHPHRHGSTALQVGGGAAGAIIVEDDDSVVNFLPPQVTSAREVLMIVQEMDLEELQEIASESLDPLLLMSGQTQAGSEFVLVNGQLNPTINLQPGEWIRMRIIYAGWLEGTLDISIPGCEMQLIAKDGIYLRDIPRSIDEASLVNAARADIMVRCNGLDEIFPIARRSSSDPIATLKTSAGPAVDSTAIAPPSQQIQYPTYLADLRDTPATPGCSCPTDVDDLVFPSDLGDYVHTTFPGAIVERSIEADEHVYHQHVHPFQLISGFGFGAENYYQPGDWHDSIQDSGVIRYMPTVFDGKVMIHCHILTHEDEGMMAIEYINATGNSCECGEFDEFPVVLVAVLVAIGGFLLLAAAAFFLFRRMRRTGTSTIAQDADEKGNQDIDDEAE